MGVHGSSATIIFHTEVTHGVCVTSICVTMKTIENIHSLAHALAIHRGKLMKTDSVCFKIKHFNSCMVQMALLGTVQNRGIARPSLIA